MKFYKFGPFSVGISKASGECKRWGKPSVNGGFSTAYDFAFYRKVHPTKGYQYYGIYCLSYSVAIWRSFQGDVEESEVSK